MKFFESDLCFQMPGIAITVFEWCFIVFLCFLISGVSFCCRHGKGSLDPPPASPQHCLSPWPLAFPIGNGNGKALESIGKRELEHFSEFNF